MNNNENKHKQKQENWYLESLNIDSFGAYYNKKINGLKPGFNIVFGNNETGKSTISNFIEGILTGWINRKNVAKKQLNTYKANNNDRAGSLVFVNKNTNDKILLQRINNKEFNCYGSANELVIPSKEDYETIYSLTSDRLWDLGKNEKEITAQFLTAETGTKKAPAEALQNVEDKIDAFSSKAKKYSEVSIKQLDEKIEDLEYLINVEEYEIEKVNKFKTEIPQIKVELKNIEEEIKVLEERVVNNKDLFSKLKFYEDRLVDINTKLSDANLKLDSYLSYSKNNTKINETNKIDSNVKINKIINTCSFCGIALSAICTILCFIFKFDEIFFTISKGVFVFALIVVLLNFIYGRMLVNEHSNKSQQGDFSVQNIELIQLQTLINQLEEEEKNMKTEINALTMNENSNISSKQLLHNIDEDYYTLKSLKEKKEILYKKLMGLEANNNSKHIEKINAYKQELAILKNKRENLLEKFLLCLYARKILVDANEEWKQNSQPQVYKDAGNLLAIMTNNKWSRILLQDNKLCISDRQMSKVLETDKLSFSTRQQLYLSLRIAILLRPESYGKNIPVLCDDILINFDESRKFGAIKVLCELAKKRQVIMFTCHHVKDLENNENINFLRL